MRKITTYFALFVCVFFWASNFIIGNLLVQQLQGLTVAVLRLIAIVLFLGCISFGVILRTKIPIKSLIYLFVAGLLGVAINHYSFYSSLEYTSPITAALILACAPIVTFLINKWIYREKRNFMFWIGTIISLLGVWLIITKGQLTIFTFGKGEVFSVITMISFSLFLIIVNHLSKFINVLIITFYTNAFGLLVLLPFVETSMFTVLYKVDTYYWILLFSSAIIINGLSNLIWNYKMKDVGSTNASILLNFEPAIAMILSIVVLNEYATHIQMMGALLIFLGVMLCIFHRKLHYRVWKLNL